MMIKGILKRVALCAAAGAVWTVFCGEPLAWERVPNRPAPAQFDTYHGEALEFRCAFTGFGALPFEGASDVRLWYQTNGMGAAWWSLPATVASNTVSATFPPSADPGADRMVVFFGAPSNAYAAAQVRFRNSPGPHPNDLEPPSVLDWQAELAAATNALGRELRAEIAAAEPGNYETVSNRAMTALQAHQSLTPATNYTDTAVAAATNALVDGPISDNSARLDEMDGMIERLENMEHPTTNDVVGVITNLGQVINDGRPKHIDFGNSSFYSETIRADAFDAVVGWADYHDGQGGNLQSALDSKADATNAATKGELAAAVAAATNALVDGPISDNSARLDEMDSITQSLDGMIERLEKREYITTNAVGNIVTNKVFTRWKSPESYNGYTYAPSLAWLNSNGNHSVGYFISEISQNIYGDNEMNIHVEIYFYEWSADEWFQTENTFGDDFFPADSEIVVLLINGGYPDFVITRDKYNPLGIASYSDIPTNNTQLANGEGYVKQAIITNEVYAIVTGKTERIGFGDWLVLSGASCTISGVEYSDIKPMYYEEGNGWYIGGYNVSNPSDTTTVAVAIAPWDATRLEVEILDDYGEFTFIATRDTFYESPIGYIGLEKDVGGGRTALTVGSRTSTNRGTNSVAFGQSNSALGTASFAQGSHNSASGGFSVAMGRNATSGSRAFTWNQGTSTYSSHGTGTFNINPQNGIYGMYIGDSSLYDILLSAIGNRSTNTVTFLDEDGDVEDEVVYPPLGVAKSEDLIPIQNSVNAMWATMYGENVWIAITNYMRQVSGTVPSLRLWEVRDGGTNLVYSSAEEIEHIATQKVNAAKAELEGKMPRKAWGSYQSSGEDNPSSNSVTVVNSEKIMLTGGGKWFKTIETDGHEVWVLHFSGINAIGGDTNGFFRVCDAEGNAQLEVVKTADKTVSAIPTQTDFDSDNNFTVTFNTSGSAHPTASCALDLGDDFEAEDGSGNINSLGITVSWAKNENDLWVATFHLDNPLTKLFVYAKAILQGENLVRNNAPASLDGGIYINNVKYRLVPYETGGKTYLTLEVW